MDAREGRTVASRSGGIDKSRVALVGTLTFQNCCQDIKFRSPARGIVVARLPYLPVSSSPTKVSLEVLGSNERCWCGHLMVDALQ